MPDVAQTPEAVAFQLMEAIRAITGPQTVTRGWILDTFAECLAAASGRRPHARPELSSLHKETNDHPGVVTTIGPTEDGI